MSRRRIDIPQEHQSQFRRAMRLLLTQPLLVAGVGNEEEFRLVRSLAPELRDWFDRETGWRLLVDAQTARLYKATASLADSTYPARDPRSRAAFGRQRYVLACLALAVLERADHQITLGRLAEQILQASADPELASVGFHFGLERRDEGVDLVAVVRLLLDWGLLRRVSGEEEAYLGGTGDVLYDVDRRVLSSVLSATAGPSLIRGSTFEEWLTGLTAEVQPDTEELRNRALRHRLTRRLLDEPVVYYDELTEPELAYLTSQRPHLTGRITEATGLIAEIRAEGIAMVDPDDELTDVRMPAQGMQSHLTLLLAAHLAGKPDGATLSELHGLTRALAIEHKAYWRKNATDAGAEIDLVDNALNALQALKLVTVGEGTDPLISARPALSRYALAEPTIRVPRKASHA
ncbi:MAG TPA: TIGR02678 family protein [Propionibacteriaceae bacterium]|nr:TIGR02678 family protein [Propionibacteriaceae bacterium]